MNTRAFIRHPAGIPIDYSLTDEPVYHHDSVSNVSIGGLCFSATHPIEKDQWLHLHIPINSEHFEIDAQVKWCHGDHSNHYEIGVQFCNYSQAFSARMVEQVCHIEQYKTYVLATQGRVLSHDQAAAEWIEKYAEGFPDTTDERAL